MDTALRESYIVLRTATRKGRLVVSLMNPGIGAVLDTAFHRQGLMMRAWIASIGVLVQGTGPDQGTAAFRWNRDVQFGKTGATTRFHSIQIKEDR